MRQQCMAQAIVGLRPTSYCRSFFDAFRAHSHISVYGALLLRHPVLQLIDIGYQM